MESMTLQERLKRSWSNGFSRVLRSSRRAPARLKPLLQPGFRLKPLLQLRTRIKPLLPWPRLRLIQLHLALAILLGSAGAETARDRVTVGDDGLIRVRPKYPNVQFENPWPAEMEQDFLKRVDAHIRTYKGKSENRTTGEHEKGAYPNTMYSFLAGDYDVALEALQAEDIQAKSDHAHTLGIDLYWCFTLKGQVLKYFYFGDVMKPAYRQRMFDAGKAWTKDDPRPSLEYTLALGSKDPQVRKYALQQLGKMWRSPKHVREMANKAISENQPNKRKFGEYMLSFALKLERKDFEVKHLTHWMRIPPAILNAKKWAKGITDGGWMIFEEYERRTNPNPHPKYGIGTGPVGADWSPRTRGMRADARNTDNLRAMREVAIYLFAEEAGNETVRRLYKEKLRRTVFAFWEIGNGEWDSEGYLGHTISAYSNLYAFAKDKQVRGWGKAILDFLFLSAAQKYWRGAWGGPLIRDYGNITPWSGSANLCHLFFGDAPGNPNHHEKDQVFLICSGYRPPAAVVALARKQFKKPCEMLNSHPHYENWLPGNSDAPLYHETMYYGHSYQLGTMPNGHGYNRNAFKLLIWNSETGADFFIPTTGRFRHTSASTAGGDNIAQYRNLAIYLNGKAWKGTTGTTPFNYVVPKSAETDDQNGIRFLRFEKTWMALTPVNLAFKELKPLKNKRNIGSGLHLMTAEGTGGKVCGFAIELGEEETHGSYETFKSAVLNSSKLDYDDNTAVAYSGCKGNRLKLSWMGAGLPKVWRNGKPHDWMKHFALYQPSAGSIAPATLGWKKRKLSVKAGGYGFDATLHDDGVYEFKSLLK
ncbi:MAG: hypothetical protein QF473_22155 [Planctomycetota bacterium]|nr:hypothetical protein [Planctomycetota bacterium]